MVTYLYAPKFLTTVTHGGVSYYPDVIEGRVQRVENGFDSATLIIDNVDCSKYSSNLTEGDPIKIEVKDVMDTIYTTIFQGIISIASPILGAKHTVKVECLGAGYGLADMVCNQEYGTQSLHPTIDKISEILTDATYGIITKYANHILGSATDSGFNYTTTIEDIVGSMSFLSSPYKPCDKTINDVCDLLTAIKAGAAGPHWIVDTDSQFLLSTIGAHNAAVIAAGWDSIYGAVSTATVEDLYTDAFNATTVDWSETGASPYLNDSDDNYIVAMTDALLESYWTFPASAGSGIINSVKIRYEAFHTQVGDYRIQTEIWDGGAWVDYGTVATPTPYSWVEVDVSATLTTWALINGCRVRFTSVNPGVGWNCIRRLTRKTDYTPPTVAATLEEGKDFTAYTFEKLKPEANYIVYHGLFKKPSDGDKWTEDNSALWAVTNGAVADEHAIIQIGTHSLKFTPTTIGGSWIDYPSAHNAAWDMTKIGGKFNIPELHFWVYNGTGATFGVRMFQSGVGYFTVSSLLNPPANTWHEYTIPLGPYAKTADGGLYWVPTVVVGTPVWSDIDYIQFIFYSNTGSAYIDGLCFNGWIQRGAYNSTNITANKCKIKPITDNVAKDDSMKATDDSGCIAQMAYAELLKCQTTPTVGEFPTSMVKDVLPGQLIHVHAEKTVSATFTINMDMRIQKLVHNWIGENASTSWTVTSDVLNSRTRTRYGDYNRMAEAFRPGTQDRQASSVTMGLIDLTQERLEKDYP